MADKLTIQKNPPLVPAEDYNFLRQQGMDYIEELGSALWTDYNIHDPGITILEALCYAITDLGYRTSYDIKDLLAEPVGTKPDHARQAFFTARQILTINPWTTEDFRKLLADIIGVKNAWLFCKECPCDEMFLYANCTKSKLQYKPVTEHKIIVKGFYDVLIEFEDDDGVGNMNSGKIKYNFSFITGTGSERKLIPAAIELRLPSWQQLEDSKDVYRSFRKKSSIVTGVVIKFISGNKGDNQDIPEDELGNGLRKPLYITAEVTFAPDANDVTITENLLFEDVPMNVWFRSDSERKLLPLPDLSNALNDISTAGIFAKYSDKIKKADDVMKEAKYSLHNHRNLCEDYCKVQAVQVEDIAVCADMDVTPDADIEKVLAQAYYLIDQYFSPDIKFYSLKELLDAGTPVDEIFEGPALNNGFINNEQLAATQLKKILHTSDVINLLMDIPGVIAVRNLVLVRYDDEGKRVQAESWTLPVSYNHQPRLYIEGSKFLVFKNGLPFLPDKFELWDTLQVIKGLNAQPSYATTENDLPVPEGVYSNLQEYYPVQHSLPLTYGTGPDGLPPHASQERRAQAKQLKAYLMFFEQILVNYLSQISHIKDLFALDNTVSQSYFSNMLLADVVSGVDDLYDEAGGSLLNATTLQNLVETELTFNDRRNRFLDHLLARFAEQFSDYALMLYSYTSSKELADEILIQDKIAFLKDFPFMSANRGKAFNYKDEATVCSNKNISGLETRIRRLLGFKETGNYFELYEETDTDGKPYEQRWRLIDENRNIYLSGSTRYVGIDLATADAKARKEIREVMKYITTEARYEVKKEKKWCINLTDTTGEVIATRKQSFKTKDEALKAVKQIIEFGKMVNASEKIFIVEHLLLRPRNKTSADFANGDPLLPICVKANCLLCGEEDPYSFRITIVLNGEDGLANQGIEFRRFAEKTIREEVPAHLGVKICWVNNDQLLKFEQLYCDWLAELAKEEPLSKDLHDKLVALLFEFNQLKSVYPKASLHDCVDGNDENRVYLNQTII